MSHIKNCYKNYANCNGRATRKEFWLFYLFVNAVGLILWLLAYASAAALGYFSAHPSDNIFRFIVLFLPFILFIIPSTVPVYAVGARRLHDAGFSAWLQILIVIPYASLVVIILWCLKSKHGDNQYGPDPFNRQSLPKD